MVRKLIVEIPEQLHDLLIEKSEGNFVSKSAIVRLALKKYCDNEK